MEDVLVVGGGVIGLCSALELSRRGLSVAVLDAGAEVPSASWAGGGILSPLFPWRYPDAVGRLTADAVPRYRQLVDEIAEAGGPVPELDQCGLLIAMPGDREAAMHWASVRNQPVRAVLSREVQTGLSFDAGLFFPSLGAIRNPGLLEGLRWLLAQRGISVHRERVRAIDRVNGGVMLEGMGEARRAGRVLLAAGKECAGLLDSLGVRLPLFPAKGEMLLYRASPGLLRTVVLTDQGYLIPRRDGRILAGSTLEPGVDSTVPSREAGQRLHRQALALFPELQGCPLEAQWAGVRPGCEDDVPRIGALPGQSGIWVATGHYRNGLVSAPATAALVADLMTGETPSIDPRPYAPAC